MANTQKLKAVIVEKSLTQSKLAQKIGLDKGTLSRKINNVVPFTVEEAKKIAIELDISNEEATKIFFE